MKVNVTRRVEEIPDGLRLVSGELFENDIVDKNDERSDKGFKMALTPTHSYEVRWTALLLGTLVALLMPGCRRPSDMTSATDVSAIKLKAVVLVTIDTLRADHLGVYGYELPTSPNIDSLAQESIVFQHAISTCPATAPATASILTGLYRAAHGVERNGSVMPDEGVESIAEIFQRNGYHTAGFIANPAVGQELGFAQGFDEFAFPHTLTASGPGRLGGEPLVERARKTLEQAALTDQPLFMWLHFMDPHGAYYPPQEVRDLFQLRDYEGSDQKLLPLSEKHYGLDVVPRYQGLIGQKPGDLLAASELKARYDAEIRYVDSHVAGLIGIFQELDFWEKTALILTADHGESLGEHNYYFQHGWYTYEDSIRVPLLIRLPGRKGPVRVSRTVSMVDLAPTILELAGIEPSPKMEGTSLLHVDDGDPHRFAFSQTFFGNQLTSLTHGRYKYIYTPPPPGSELESRSPDGWEDYWPQEATEELYDLDTDPGENSNIAQEQRNLVFWLRRELRVWFSRQREHDTALLSVLEGNLNYREQVRRSKRNTRLREQLHALGYL